MEIVKVYRESFPALRLIGKKYSNKDDIGAKWGQWHQNGWFDAIESLGLLPQNNDAYVGAKRICEGAFEYWIGMLFPQETGAPEGFEAADIAPLDMAVCWLYGGESSGELTSMEAHNKCLSEIAERGYARRENEWCFEMYNCPRFTTPDEKGNVILDYCVAVNPEA